MSEGKKKPRLAVAAGLISAATMLSRVLGLVREQLFAALMGANFLADAFTVAFRIPNLLRDLFAEGALSQAFVPTFKSELINDGPERAYALGNRLAGTLLCLLGVIALIAGLLAPQIVAGLSSDFRLTPGKFELTVELTRIMLPFLPIVSLAAVAMGMLNAQDRYAAPALAPATFNVVSICVGAALFLGGVSGRWVVIGWAIGTVAGGAMQLGIQLPSLYRMGFRLRPRSDLRLRDPSMRRIGRLMLPAVIGVGAVQINIIVNTVFATSTEGAVSWLNYAFRFLQLPIGVFGVAIATVSTTRYSDAAARGKRDAIVGQATEALRLTAFLTVPATVGLVVLGEPIIRLIFEHGEFGQRDSAATVAALNFYALGLVAYASIKVMAPAFYAIDHARIPMVASIAAVAANLILNITLHPYYGYKILALGTAAAATMNFAVLYVAFQKKVGRIAHLGLLLYLLRVGTAAGLMGAAVWGARYGLESLFPGSSLGARAIIAMVPVTVGVVVYGACALAFRLTELRLLLRRGRR